jgi:hypothetical protein
MTPNEAVEKLAAEYAKAEKYLSLARRAINRMPAFYMAVHTAGAIGYLEQLQRSARASAAAGLVANAELAVADAHVDDTARAQELKLDVPVVLSGGR